MTQPNPIQPNVADSQPLDPDKLKAILGNYKVIGDTTFGLGYKETEELVADIQLLAQKAGEKAKSEFLIINTNNLVSPPHNFIDPERTEE